MKGHLLCLETTLASDSRPRYSPYNRLIHLIAYKDCNHGLKLISMPHKPYLS
jgi:hypothetical protein